MQNRLIIIDSLRGIAAFGVVLFHFIGGFSTYIIAPTFFNTIPAFGYSGVFLFFIISGFCIHLRWTKRKVAGHINPKIDFVSFWKRRWIRLYPAYIATLVLFISYQWWTGILSFNMLFVWDLTSHLLMIHNFDSRTVYSINGVLWTIAIEEQLYLLYFVLLWMRQRFGWVKTLVICLILRFVWFSICLISAKAIGFALPYNESALANWWIWALGAVAVENYYGLIKLPKWNYSIVLSVLLLSVAAFLHYSMFSFENNLFTRLAVQFEYPLWGAGFYLLVNRIMTYESVLKKLQVISASAFVGIFSYSIYLTHDFVLNTFWWAISIPAVLVFAYLFYLLFEKTSVKYLNKKTVH